MMKIFKMKDYDQMSQKAANLIAAQIITKPDCVLGLATGSSPIGTYKQLIEKYNNGDRSKAGTGNPGGISGANDNPGDQVGGYCCKNINRGSGYDEQSRGCGKVI